jgi:hypothetical protein
LEQGDRRDALNPVLLGDISVGVDVDFNHAKVVSVCVGEDLQLRCNYFARSAPASPKIHKDWNRGVEDLTLKGTTVIYVDDISHTTRNHVRRVIFQETSSSIVSAFV